MRHSRPAAGLLIAFVVALGNASPPARATNASIDELTAAQNSLVRLEARADRAQQQYAAALTRERAAQQSAAASEHRSKAAETVAAHARAQLGLLVAAAYRAGPGASLSSLSLVLDAGDAGGYLHGMQQTQRVVINGDEVLAHANAASAQADAARQHAAANLDALTAAKTLVARSTAEATDAVATASRDLDALGIKLDTLLLPRTAAVDGEPSEAARWSLNTDTDTHTDTSPPPPRRPYHPDVANRALDFALAQVGKPYTWGGTGPSSFDCSGLAMRAYEAAGVRLPHFAAFQYAASHPVARSQLKPGDLLFWARNPRKPATIYHEALYLGGGLMVQAPKTHWRISVASMWMWGPIQFYARPY
jgi:peptidoglycan DL-endopeptidase CwlO